MPEDPLTQPTDAIERYQRELVDWIFNRRFEPFRRALMASEVNVEVDNSFKAMAEKLMAESTRIKEEFQTALTQELYKEANRSFRPLYPWVLVRVLEKENVTKSGIILPAIDQSKVINEGIVIATWRPFTKEIGKLDANGNKFTRTIEKRSSMVIGEHVIYPHWAGMPIHGFSDKLYRVVREEDWEESKQGGIFGKVDYEDGDDTTPHNVLYQLLHDFLLEGGPVASDEEVAMLVVKLEHRFLLVDRQRKSVTLSCL